VPRSGTLWGAHTPGETKGGKPPEDLEKAPPNEGVKTPKGFKGAKWNMPTKGPRPPSAPGGKPLEAGPKVGPLREGTPAQPPELTQGSRPLVKRDNGQ